MSERNDKLVRMNKELYYLMIKHITKNKDKRIRYPTKRSFVDEAVRKLIKEEVKE